MKLHSCNNWKFGSRIDSFTVRFQSQLIEYYCVATTDQWFESVAPEGFCILAEYAIIWHEPIREVQTILTGKFGC